MRPLLFLTALVACLAAGAQVIARKTLAIELGAGVNVLSSTSDTAFFALSNSTGGTFDFAFAYAIADRFTLGAHYQRLGHTVGSDPVERLRITSYQIEAGWVAWQRSNGAVLLTAALGTAIPSFTLAGQGLPASSGMGLFTLGGRYLHRFTEVIGIYAAIELPRSGIGALSVGDAPLSLADGRRITMNWSAVTLESGILVRF